MTAAKPKLVCFDLNQTLIAENTWYDLNLAMGVTPEEDTLFLKWFEEGIITYEEGQNCLSRIYLSRNRLSKAEVLKVISRYTFRPGAEELVKYLHGKSYKIAIVSGSVDLLVAKVASELNIDYHGANNTLDFDAAGHFRRIICWGEDAQFKLFLLKKFCTELGIGISDCVCVGDGYNDLKIFADTGNGITFKGSKIENYASQTISSLSDLKKIL